LETFKVENKSEKLFGGAHGVEVTSPPHHLKIASYSDVNYGGHIQENELQKKIKI
jgi:hypothetical protein